VSFGFTRATLGQAEKGPTDIGEPRSHSGGEPSGHCRIRSKTSVPVDPVCQRLHGVGAV